MRIRILVLLLCLLGCLLRPASAQLLFNLNPAGLTGSPGGSVTFNATLTNSGSDTVWLNGDASTLGASGFSIDDSPYLNNFPFFLIGGDAATADLFTVNIAPSVVPGNYFGSFSIVGGADPFAQDTLATQNFEVSVASSVPELGCMGLLFGLGLFVSGVGAQRLRCRRLSMRQQLPNCLYPTGLTHSCAFWLISSSGVIPGKGRNE